MNIPVQHLSDEAVAAYADGMLATPAHNRATRHLAQCLECAGAVDEQRAAVLALRAAPEPALPFGLLERLRAVPITTPLAPRPMALAPDGSAVFPAFGTSAGAAAPARAQFHFAVPVQRLVGRRTQHLALVTAAAAMITVGIAASTAASAAGSGRPVQLRPVTGANTQQLVSTRRPDSIDQDVDALLLAHRH